MTALQGARAQALQHWRGGRVEGAGAIAQALGRGREAGRKKDAPLNDPEPLRLEFGLSQRT